VVKFFAALEQNRRSGFGSVQIGVEVRRMSTTRHLTF